MTTVSTTEALEAIRGPVPPAMLLKVIDHLDPGALRWISRSPLAFLGIGSATGLRMTLAGGEPGFASGDRHRLFVPVAGMDEPALAMIGSPVGTLFLLPGVGEALRVNGTVVELDGSRAVIEVEECYGHCAKAMIRSQFWTAAPCRAPEDIGPFVDLARFLALATMGAQGCADVSPKGDPAGSMVRLDGDTLWFADRPGNRRHDSFRNILERQVVSVALLVPGSEHVVMAQGTARLTHDPAVRARFEVQGKVPELAVGVQLASIEVRESGALKRAALWPVRPEQDIDPAKLFIDHVRLNKAGGLGAALTRASLALPGMKGFVRKGLDKDYDENLY